jgi:2-pyrone-4,6-dicarboxylate lactonase
VAKPFHDDMTEALAALRPPSQPLPDGACDTHVHVFGPFDRFPLAAERRYTPPVASYEDYIAMLDRVGMAHGVLVHGGAHGYDNGAMLNALTRGGGRLRGIAVVAPNVTDAELDAMHAVGVRGIRFTEMGGPPGAPPPGVLGLAELEALAPRLRKRGWHAQLWAKSGFIVANAERLRALGLPVVFDHMGQFDVALGVTDPAFQALLGLMGQGPFWLKLTALRVSQSLPDMQDVRPYHEALAKAAPDRLIWGSDWPFIGLGDRLPNVGHLLDTVSAWTADRSVFRNILVSNPRTLYGF